MGEWILSVEGTETGRHLAIALALLAAVVHAAFGAMQKGRHDPWVMRGVIDLWASAMMLPFALFVVPLPSWEMVAFFPGMMVIHLFYKYVLAMAYSRGAFTAVYPIVRGTGPLATVIFAGLVFGEYFNTGQWIGVALLSGAIFGLACVNLAEKDIDPVRLRAAFALAFITGLSVAAYTVYDAFLIRLAADPFTFLVWFFLLEGVLFPAVTWRRIRDAGITRDLMTHSAVAALMAYVSFGSVFMATRLDKVGEAAALRETSVVFAALIGWFFLGERIGRVRAALMVLIALGAVLVEFG